MTTATIEEASFAFCTVDDDGLIVAANEAAARYLSRAMRDRFVGAQLARCLSIVDGRNTSASDARADHADEPLRSADEIASAIAGVVRGDGERSIELTIEVDGAVERVQLACQPLASGKRAIFFVRAADRAERAMTLLADCAALLQKAGDIGEQLRAFTSTLRSIADVAVVDLDDGSERLHRIAVSSTPAFERVAGTLAAYAPVRTASSPIWRALDSTYPLVLEEPDANLFPSCAERDVDGDLASARATSAAFVPLVAHGQPRGVLFLATAGPSPLRGSLGSALDGSLHAPLDGALHDALHGALHDALDGAALDGAALDGVGLDGAHHKRLRTRDLPTLSMLAHLAAGAVEEARVRGVVEQVHKRHRSLIKMVEQEFRAQLAVTSLAVNTLQRTAPVDDKRTSKRHLDVIHRATTRMSATVASVSDAFGLDATWKRMQPAAYACKALAYDVVEASAPFALEKKVNVVVECPDALEVFCDRARTLSALSAIMRELIKRATAVDMPILLRIERSGKTAVRFSFEHPQRAEGPTPPWQFDADGPFDLFMARVLIALQQGALDVSNASDGALISAWLPSPASVIVAQHDARRSVDASASPSSPADRSRPPRSASPTQRHEDGGDDDDDDNDDNGDDGDDAGEDESSN